MFLLLLFLLHLQKHEIYLNGFGEIEFTDMKNGKIISKNYSFVYWEVKDIVVPDYSRECNMLGNKTEVCEDILVGSKIIKKGNWEDYNSNNIPKGNITIGLKTHINPLEKIDIVWEIVGKKIKKHAVVEGTFQFTHSAVSSANALTYNFTGVNFSIADVNRVIVIGTGGRRSTPNANVTTISINGVNATKVIKGFEGGSGAEIWFAQLPAGTSGFVTVNWGTQQLRTGIGVWAIYTSNPVPTDSSRFNITNGVATLDVPKDGVVIGYAFVGSSASSTWTGLTENFDTVAEVSQSSTGALNGSFASEVLGYNITLSNNVSGNDIMVVASWGIGSTPNVTLNSPIESFNSTNATIDFNGTVVSVSGITNVTLFIDGILNETNSSGINDTNYLFTKTVSEGIHNWTYESCNNAGCTTATTRNFTVDTTFPEINLTSPRGVIDFTNGTETLNWTITSNSLDTCFFDYNFTNTTIGCSLNTTTFTLTSQRNLTFWANDSAGNLNLTFTNWSYVVIQNTATFNVLSFETASETFTLNITTNGTAPKNANLIYSGSSSTATITNTAGDNYDISKTIDIPLGEGNNTWFFNITIGDIPISSTSNEQIVSGINLTFCQASPQNIPYINFSFSNETTNQEDLTASIASSEWTYFLGTGSVNRTLSYANTTEAFSYAFCFTPPNRTISTTLDLAYTNPQSQQRIFNPTLLTLSNLTVQQTLFLLPTILGLFTQFSTQDTLGNTLTAVSAVITRTLGGSTVTITSDETDGSGLVVFFLNPDVTYTATFSLTGFVDNVFSFVPVTDLRTVIMGSGVTVPVNGSTISLGTNFEIQPSNNSLSNNTIVTFSFNVTGTSEITLISMNITNSTNQLGFQSNAGIGFISANINTNSNTRIFGQFIIQTVNETIVVKKVWIIGNEFVGDYSIFNQLTLFNDYGFDDFFKFLIVLFTIAGVLIFMSTQGQIEDEIKMAVVILIVWAFSIVSWLNTGIAINSSSTNINALTQFSNQFGIAILTTGAGAYFILRRTFRQI